MSELYERIVSQRGSLERLVARIPGFRGYQENQARRTADRMLRDFLADQVKQRVERLISIEKLILDGGGLAYMTRTRDVKSRLRRYQDSIETAVPGYSGMFAQIKIGPEELEKIYSFDEAQMRYLDQFDEALDRLQTAAASKDGLESAIAALDGVITEALNAFALRDDVLTNLGKNV